MAALSGPVLLIGGPMDGVFMAVLEPDKHVEAQVPDGQMLKAIRTATPYEGPGVHLVRYIPKVINLFGMRVRVHVMEGTPSERWEAGLFHHLISDNGKGLVV